jgi:hypothetical protein
MAVDHLSVNYTKFVRHPCGGLLASVAVRAGPQEVTMSPKLDSNEVGRYDQVLNRSRNLTTATPGAIEGRPSSQPQRHRVSLVDLHPQSRGIAAVPNQALVAWHSINCRL